MVPEQSTPGESGPSCESLLLNQMNHRLKTSPTTDRHGAVGTGKRAPQPARRALRPARSRPPLQPAPLSPSLVSTSADQTSKTLPWLHFTTDLGCAVWNNANIPRSTCAAQKRKFFSALALTSVSEDPRVRDHWELTKTADWQKGVRGHSVSTASERGGEQIHSQFLFLHREPRTRKQR